MELFESESVAYGGINTAAPAQAPQSPPQQHEELTQDQSGSSLNKQSSIFLLTLDEIQLKSGKTFGSMNMDEFLANLWNVEEENQAPPQVNQNDPCNDKGNGGNGGQPTLARQGSFSIPTPLCKKTVDEVWFEIQKDLPQLREANHEPPQRQQTFGEMTLEDFLVKAGVVQESAAASSQQKKAAPMQTNGTSLAGNYGMGDGIRSSQQKMLTSVQNNSGNMDANFGMGHVMGVGFPGHQIVASNLAAPGNGYATAYPIFTQNKTVMGESSNVAENGNGTDRLLEPVMIQNRKRIIDGPLEVVVERRQRRMIKNRESAARSRARKQAYTVELELELNQLKQENAKLKQIAEENEQRRKQEVLKRKQSKLPLQRKVVDKMRTLRRTVSLG
ncbi:Alpha/beta-hydrolases family protein isoform 1 [Hibiscus syriacus]|uniref:Alpha/beta-hydrolases family protein isoform 1 n=1 Tax=Hibiscus syriacus TaxID=106335 RepID=A0A6A2ZNI3_HIBSY|nr:ABSCISIC ACID-INSENSITIVE 5-like protein 1 [Hibiscus syriacus]KAE8693017.1 Alpha/beta-hydrolases family protein isoform 1 [Hibiscus syriacus]